LHKKTDLKVCTAKGIELILRLIDLHLAEMAICTILHQNSAKVLHGFGAHAQMQGKTSKKACCPERSLTSARSASFLIF